MSHEPAPDASAGVPADGSAPAKRAWPAPIGMGPLAAVVGLPGSKSLTNRMLILAALSDAPTRITSPLRARDTTLMAGALRSLGIGIDSDGADWLVRPAALHGGAVDCGLAGTVMRFVPPVAALASGPTAFDGDAQARTRPMGRLIAALRLLGVRIEDGGRGALPFSVAGTGGVRGGAVELDASASSQFVSALLLAAPRFDAGIEIRHIGPRMPSLPHVEMTVAALRAAGASVDDGTVDRWAVEPGPLNLPDVVIEPDLSNAAPFLGAAMVLGGSVTVPHWPSHTDQAGDELRRLLVDLGAEVELGPAGLTVTGTGRIQPLDCDLHDVSELTPVVAALCALAEGESRIRGVAHIRGHETDRLAAIQTELTNLGAVVTQTPDGVVICPAPLRGGRWRAHADHRMAQAGALLGLRVPGVLVDDIASTTKTMADFPERWGRMLGQVAQTSPTSEVPVE